jgi:hypothetical protein
MFFFLSNMQAYSELFSTLFGGPNTGSKSSGPIGVTSSGPLGGSKSSGPIGDTSSGPLGVTTSGSMGVRNSGSMDVSMMPPKKRMLQRVEEVEEPEDITSACSYMFKHMRGLYPGEWNKHHWDEYYFYSTALQETSVLTGFLALKGMDFDIRRSFLLSRQDQQNPSGASSCSSCWYYCLVHTN